MLEALNIKYDLAKPAKLCLMKPVFIGIDLKATGFSYAFTA